MAKNFVRIGLWPCAPAVARDLIPLLAAHKAEMGYDLGINSIYRTKSEQAAIFTSRYTRGGYSRFGDYRTYQGATWGRHSGLGPVASPDVGSNHTRGYAVDFAISAFSPSFTWLKNNAHRWGFNHTEGSSISEPWHWCWKVGIFPTASSPDPWEGRGAPDPVYASDPGLNLDDFHNGAAGGGGNEEEMNSEERKMLSDALRYAKGAYERSGLASSAAQWLKARIKGSVKQKSITTTVSEARDAAQWNKARIRGSVNDPSVTAMLESIMETVAKSGTTRADIMARAAVIEKTLNTDPEVEVAEIDEPVE